MQADFRNIPATPRCVTEPGNLTVYMRALR